MKITNYPKITKLTILGSEINQLPERCDVSKITFDYVNRGIEKRNLFDKLMNDFSGHIQFAMFEPTVFDQLYNALYNVSGGLEGMEDKLGIKESGHRLLIAYIFEAIQRKYFI
jgi:hypothetical protein